MNPRRDTYICMYVVTPPASCRSVGLSFPLAAVIPDTVCVCVCVCVCYNRTGRTPPRDTQYGTSASATAYSALPRMFGLG